MAFTTPRTWVAGDVFTAAQMNVDVRDNMTAVAAAIAPTGAVLPYAGSAAPTNWLLCDGTAQSRATFSALFAVIGTTYGAGDGSTTFNVPDMRQRMPLGKAVSGTGSTLGAVGGSKDALVVSHNHTQDSHNHTQGSHNHTQNGHNHTQNAHGHSVDGDSGFRIPITVSGGNHALQDPAQPGTTVTVSMSDIDSTVALNQLTTPTNQAAIAANNAFTATNQAVGSGGTDANLPPFVTLNYLIKT